MKNRFNLIIFDWDGTLINSIDWIIHCLQKSADYCHYQVPDQQAARDVIGLSLDQAFATLFPGLDEQKRKKLVTYYNREYFSRELVREDLFPGVFDMLMKLQDDGLYLAVATGKTRSGLDRALASTGTKELFHVTRCADETASKPNPMMLQEIIRSANLPSSQALMVGDTAHDLQMAHNAKISSIAVTCGAHSQANLQLFKPLVCLQQPSELLNYFLG